ncbi:MAG: DUF4339 domain-containing protein [Thermoguttaceae bacterium]|nr:DUF4339 domain-containing protein [Thermoguttaceae bacterium]
MAVQWYYKMAGKEIGPFTSQELKQLADEKRITPNDPVRRDTDKEWTLAKNVKGLFPAAGAIPMGVAVPVPPKEPPVVVPTVKDPPVVVPTAKKIPTPPLPKTVQEKKEEPEPETFDFGFDSSVSHGTKSGKTSSVKRPATKLGAKTASKKGAAEDGEETEKKPLSKKEIQKRNFMIIGIATGAVIVLAVLILVIVSCKGSSKPKVTDENAVAEEEVLTDETAETSDDEKAESDTQSDEEDGDKNADEEVKAAEENGIPAEYAEEGYKTPYVDGKWQSCTFGSAKVFIRKIKNAKLSDMNPNTRSPKKDTEFCFIKIEVENVNGDGILLDVPGWGAKGAAGVKLFAGKNQYKTQRFEVPDQADKDMQVDVGEKFTDVLIFNPPRLESIEALRLELPPLAQGDSACKLYLPKEMFQKKAKPAEGEDEEASGDGEEKAKAEGEESGDAENAKDSKNDQQNEKPAENKEPSALDDDTLNDKSEVQKPAASSKDDDELGRASEEKIDILNDPSLDF